MRRQVCSSLTATVNVPSDILSAIYMDWNWGWTFQGVNSRCFYVFMIISVSLHIVSSQ